MTKAGNRGKLHLSYWADASLHRHIFYALRSAPCNTWHVITSILRANMVKTESEASTHHIRRGERSVVQTGSEISDHLQDFVVRDCGIDLLKQHIKTYHTNEPGPKVNRSVQLCTWALFSLSSCCWSRRLSLFSCSFSTSFTQFDFLLAVKKKRTQNSTSFAQYAKGILIRTTSGIIPNQRIKRILLLLSYQRFSRWISTKHSHKQLLKHREWSGGCGLVPPALVHLLSAWCSNCPASQ